MTNKPIIIAAIQLTLLLSISAKTIYVNNLTGKDSNTGLEAKTDSNDKSGPVASITRAFALAKTSDHIKIANTGKPYQRPYPGKTGLSLIPRSGGTIDSPLIVNGNGAIISGLSVIPTKAWKEETERIFSLHFWPMSNMYKGYKQQNYWLDDTQIWWVNGKAASNCKNLEELKQTPGGFWWSKSVKKVLYHLPAGQELKDLKIEIPSNSGIYIRHDNTAVKNLKMIFSWNDGFDISGEPTNVIFKNCSSYNNCGQGFSCHGTGKAYYEDCVAVRCASSGSCDVHWSASNYKRCIFINNTFEAGVYATDETIHSYDDCLIAFNKPYEQIWQIGHAKQNFNNCVIIGTAGTNILKMTSGSVSFKNCTIADGTGICQLPAKSPATLNIENCILARFSKYFLNIPSTSKNHIRLIGNLYLDGPGNYVGQKLYKEQEWTDYLKEYSFATGSTWSKEKLTGPLKTNLEKPIKLMGRWRRLTTVGAKLPQSVWKRYETLLKEIPTPNGIISVENQ